jgi:hypothetical protein
MRFTIAHELAHTFFYDVKVSPPRDLLEPQSFEEVEKLESMCDEIAAELLLPEPVLRRIAVGLNFMDPDALRGLCVTSAVSPITLVIKAALNTEWLQNSGGIMVVERTSEGCFVRAAALAGIQCFDRLKLRGAPISYFFRKSSFCLNQGQDLAINTIVSFATTQGSTGFQRLEVRCERSHLERRSFFVTFKARGSPWFV